MPYHWDTMPYSFRQVERDLSYIYFLFQFFILAVIGLQSRFCPVVETRVDMLLITGATGGRVVKVVGFLSVKLTRTETCQSRV